MENVDLTVLLKMGGAPSPHLNHDQLTKPLTDMMGGF